MKYYITASQNRGVLNTNATFNRTELTVAAEGSQWIAAQNIGQPFTYEFKHKASQRNTSDSIFCHFYFFPSVMGNTVVFQYKNEPAAEIATWQGPSAPTYVSKTVTSAVTTSTGTPTSPPSGTSTSSSSSTASPSSTSTTSPASGGGLSTGASAGIGVGVAVGVLALAAAAFFFWRSRQNKRAQDSQWDRPPPSQDVSYSPPPQDFSYKYAQQTTSPAATFGGEMQGSPPPVELRGSTPEHELHSSNLKRG